MDTKKRWTHLRPSFSPATTKHGGDKALCLVRFPRDATTLGPSPGDAAGNTSGGQWAWGLHRSTAATGAHSVVEGVPALLPDPLQFARACDTAKVTSSLAESLAYPFQPGSAGSMDAVIDAFLQRLRFTAPCLRWNTPKERPEWAKDLRFFGEWWLSLRDPQSDAAVAARERLGVAVDGGAEVYSPLLTEEERTEAAENQLVADLALRLQGALYRLETIHIDSLCFTADRVQVFLFSGLMQLKDCCRTEDELQTLSFSICQLDSAGLLVLLVGLVGMTESAPPPYVTALDVSYNALTCHSLFCLTTVLPRTSVRRLSLRGNFLWGTNMVAFRDFLLTGAASLEELDLCHTNLSPLQIKVLTQSLPQLRSLHVLLLDGVNVPDDLLAFLSKAVATSHLWCISLTGCTGTQQQSAISLMQRYCDRRRKDAHRFGGADGESFFKRFFEASRAKGWAPPEVSALPLGYGPFRTNDPSWKWTAESAQSEQTISLVV